MRGTRTVPRRHSASAAVARPAHRGDSSRMVFRAIPILLLAAPASAAADAQVPEGSNLLLFALGILGVLIGRRASMRRGGKD